MPLSKFITQLSSDYPDFHFVYGKRFSFRPPKTIVIGPDEGVNTPLLALHELGHALSKKYQYSLSVERLQIERMAWDIAKKVLEDYKKLQSGDLKKLSPFAPRGPLLSDLELPLWDEDFVEDNLDSYRDWLHHKSKCPTCGLTMYQDADQKWCCPYCHQFKS
ncbi:hypothetical protein IKF27_00930 [Candidatus Saccharibacteria bacterium]|nr:hypothetical protein [Candidatus Saccharibacteria bacterium]